MTPEFRQELAKLVVVYSNIRHHLSHEREHPEYEALSKAIDTFRRAHGLMPGWIFEEEFALAQE